MAKSRKLNGQEQKDLIQTLKLRFENNRNRHTEIDWKKVQSKLEKNEEKLWPLNEMEKSGGEPDVVGIDKKNGEFIFCDCSVESPAGRRSLCYDQAALDSRKENKPKDSAINIATTMGVTLLTEEEYRYLQTLGKFDLKTSSWIKTPDNIRKLGGALFCDCRYDNVFTYHNGAESYYAARGFRAKLTV